ncbi:single-stranded DNA-binding protein [Streptomyces sp. NPDC057638]|uniref:single-stranded DNA-binding protein n=1 Tax=Streptomyces sp. NPDC057638 TaxID=3346190 RepID=UPI0036A86695
MTETMVTVVGNVATDVEYRETGSGGMVRFRIATTPRRWDRQQEGWANGPTSFYTVVAWRALAVNVMASVVMGDPLVVHGKLRVREQQGEHGGDGQRRTYVDIEAVAVGHDLTRGTGSFRRGVRPVPSLAAAPPAPAWGYGPPPPDAPGPAVGGPDLEGPDPVAAGPEPAWPHPHLGPFPALARAEAPAPSAPSAPLDRSDPVAPADPRGGRGRGSAGEEGSARRGGGASKEGGMSRGRRQASASSRAAEPSGPRGGRGAEAVPEPAF